MKWKMENERWKMEIAFITARQGPGRSAENAALKALFS